MSLLQTLWWSLLLMVGLNTLSSATVSLRISQAFDNQQLDLCEKQSKLVHANCESSLSDVEGCVPGESELCHDYYKGVGWISEQYQVVVMDEAAPLDNLVWQRQWHHQCLEW